MATTISNTTLTVKITESVSLNGLNQGGTVTRTVSAINEIYKRIVTVPVSGSGTISILETTGDAGSVVGPGKFIVGDIKYIRISNLNNGAGEGIKLQIARDDDSNGTDDECAWFLLEEGKSMIINTFDAAFDAAAGDLDSPSLDAITDIRALNESGSVVVDLEIFIAST